MAASQRSYILHSVHAVREILMEFWIVVILGVIGLGSYLFGSDRHTGIGWPLLEIAPSFGFLAFLRSGIEPQTAGWVGTALAAAVLISFGAYRKRFNPILLGINIHLLIITPLIVMVFYWGALETGRTLVTYVHQAVLVTIFATGCVLALGFRDGFFAHEGLSRRTAMAYSTILLAASLGAIVWTFGYANGVVLGVALPVMAMFGLRRLLVARLRSQGSASAKRNTT